MSSLAVNATTPSKTLSGGGDGVRNNPNQAKPLREKRAPVPSCRRFATRTNQEDRQPATPGNNKEKIERALASSVTRRTRRVKTPHFQSHSMAELTPSRKCTDNNNHSNANGSGENRGCPKKRLIEGDAGVSEASKKRRSLDAGHVIYQQLVLNAWRRRKAQVSTLIESSEQFKTQISQLLIQIDVLQKLRESECKRRESSVNENQMLKMRLEQLEDSNHLIDKEKTSLETIIKEKERQIECLKTDVENARNDLIAVRSELKVSEQQMEKERNKINSMREETKTLRQKIKQDEKCIELQKQKIKQLNDEKDTSAEKLQDAITSINNTEDKLKNALVDLQKECEENESLREKMKSKAKTIGELGEKISEMQENLNELQETNLKLMEENSAMESDMKVLETILEGEQNKPWWQTARHLMSTPMNVIHNIAYIMLPALKPPQRVG